MDQFQHLDSLKELNHEHLAKFISGSVKEVSCNACVLLHSPWQSPSSFTVYAIFDECGHGNNLNSYITNNFGELDTMSKLAYVLHRLYHS